MNDLCDRLKIERKRIGLNQEEFGKIGGVKAGAQLNYENGSRTPDATYLNNLRAAGVDVWYVLTGEHLTSQLTAEENELLSIFRKLDLRGKVNLLGMADVVGKTPTEMSKSTPSSRVGSMQFHKGVKVGQHIVGDITAPQTINVGGGKKAKKPKKNLDE